MAHFYLSAAHKSSGKTTVGIGLCAALRNSLGLRVQPFKKGPDYIDPLWLSAASRRPCHNLDFYVQSREEIRDHFARYLQGVDLGIIEGNKGLFDGLAPDGSDSNAALAALLEAPVVLVIDSRGITRGVAPLLIGYQQFTPKVNIAGVILNRVGTERHEAKLRHAVELYTDIPVLGVVRESEELRIVERHLGLMPSNEHTEAENVINRIATVVGANVDLEAIRKIADQVPRPGFEPKANADAVSGSRVRIGIARDAAFGFYYAGDLEALEAAGAELVFFDALHDSRLPSGLDGLFIGGGFPETRMSELEANVSMRGEISSFIENGGPAYAECGGLMYLCRTLTWGDKVCRMAGVIPADVVMDARPQGRGYVQLRETGLSPWPSVDGSGPEISAHEFHYSHLENLAAPMSFAYEVLRGFGIDGKHDGIVHKNLLASYAHLRDVAGNHWVRRFLAHVLGCKANGTPR